MREQVKLFVTGPTEIYVGDFEKSINDFLDTINTADVISVDTRTCASAAGSRDQNGFHRFENHFIITVLVRYRVKES